MKLTQATIATLTLPPGKAEAIFFDEDIGGFGLRLRASGESRWVYQYKLGTQHRRMTLGSLGAMSPVAARKAASELHAKVRLGIDPASEKAEGRIRAAETIAAALESYLAHQKSRRKRRSYVEVERHLLQYCKTLHGLQLAKIDRRTVASRITAVATKSGAVTARRRALERWSKHIQTLVSGKPYESERSEPAATQGHDVNKQSAPAG